jgi:FtsH-binding integral membrane protein
MAFANNTLTFEERFSPLTVDQARFVSKVYSGLTYSLIVATVACVVAIMAFKNMPPAQMRPIQIGFLVVEVVMALAAAFMRLRGTFGWIFLTVFVAITGITLAPVLIIYEQIAGIGTIAAALGLTATIFLTLTAYVRYSGKDFSWMLGFLWMGLLGAIVVGLISIFFPMPNVSYWMSWFGAVLFSGWILYDTSAVTRRYYQDDNVVGAVLNLYLDILNLFLYILRILGNRSRD